MTESASAEDVAGEGSSDEHQKKLISSLNDIAAVRAYLKRVGAEPRSMLTAAVRAGAGKYKSDVATIHLDPDGTLTVKPPWGMDVAFVAEFEPTEVERAGIAEAVKGVAWPQPVTLAALTDLPDFLKVAQLEDRLFELHDAEGRICMLQARMETDEGKYFEPWTYFSDGQWRRMEPGGLLPLWGLPQLKSHSIVYLHEGAGAARHVRRLVDDEKLREAHPWGDELQFGAHLGWIGGARSPHRTDWGALSKAGVKHIYIVSDNDEEGEAAVPRIAEALRPWPITVIAVRFDQRFPAGFDMADPLPPKFFDKGSGAYRGPPIRDLCSPATWATRFGSPPPTSDARRAPAPPVYLRKEFEREWWMVAGESKALFINRFDRSRLYAEEGFNTLVRPLSDTPRTGELFKQSAYGQQVNGIAYEPGDEEGVINVEGVRCINTWTASRIRPRDGDPEPWLDFMEGLFPRPDDRHEALRWCATLIARPNIRMVYGLLLSSTVQGVGKTTLGEIMRVQVGEKNCRSPSAKDVVESPFNSWIVRKRLVFVNEIYEGGKWGAYQKIKSFVTDSTLDANEKYLPSYSIRNWAHFILCSNSEVPLWIEDDDRRFLIPEITEVKRPREFWAGLHGWLGAGGHGIIAHWAEQFVREHGFVESGEEAPDSVRKRAMIEDSRSSEEMLVRSLAEAARDKSETHGRQVVLVEHDIVDWLETKTGKHLKPSTVRSWLRKAGLCVSKNRLKVGGRMSRVAGILPLDPADGWPAIEPYRDAPEDLEAI